MEELTKNLAERIVNIHYKDLPEKTVSMTKQFIIDYLGNCIRGWTQKNMDILYKTLGEGSGSTEASLFNGKKRAAGSVLYAALLNGAASHSLDFDDLHNPSIIHMACVTVPSALAIAEADGLSGKDILAALVAGYEAGARIGEAVNPESYYFWHTTATCGTFASAVTAGHLKKFSAAQMVQCMGTAGTQAAGLWEFLIDGAMSKTLHIGKANFAGILSAQLTANGFTAAEKILEGDKGFCCAMLKNPHWEKISEDIGGFKIDNNSFKPFACCKYTHPSVYAAQLLRKKYQLEPEQVAKIEIRSNRIVKQLVDNPNPKNPYGAKFSIQYCVAAMLKYGRLGIDEFTAENLADAEISRIKQCFDIIVDPVLDEEYTRQPDRWAVQLTVTDKKGKEYVQFVEYPKGDPPNPMTWEETVDKFMNLAGPVYGKDVCSRLCRLIADLEQYDDFGRALKACF